MELGDAILQRAGEPFLVEPVRTLDAIHLATAMAWESEVGGGLVICTRDERVAEIARVYGFGVATTPPCCGRRREMRVV
ncbi:MAG: hypothetical protein HYZ28_09310 [Myxococcales bacterium]|nr:hypothetical protein [Myxococcales bacterium]